MTENRELFRKMMRVTRRLRKQMPHPGHERFMPGPHSMGMGPGMCGPMGAEGFHKMMHRGMPREHLLAIISEYPDGVRQKELAEHAGINASSASEVVNRLEDDGYLRREVDPNDRRATILRLTELGDARACEIREEREAQFEELFGRLTEEEKDTLSALLDKMLEE